MVERVRGQAEERVEAAVAERDLMLQEQVTKLEQQLEQQEQQARVAKEELMAQVATLTAQLQQQAPADPNASTASASSGASGDEATLAPLARESRGPGMMTRLYTEANLMLNRIDLVRKQTRGEILIVKDEAFEDDEAEAEAVGVGPP